MCGEQAIYRNINAWDFHESGAYLLPYFSFRCSSFNSPFFIPDALTFLKWKTFKWFYTMQSTWVEFECILIRLMLLSTFSIFLSLSHRLFPHVRHQLSAEWLLCLMPCAVCENVIAAWKVSYKLYVFVLLNTVKNECAAKLLANAYWLLAGLPIGSSNGVRLLPPKISQ